MQIDDAATILGQADFFDICDDEQRRLLAFASERRPYAAGQALYHEGEVPEGAHIVISGVYEASPAGAKPYQIRQPGSLIGAMSLLIAKPRALTVTTVRAGETLLVPRNAFLKLVRQYPDLAAKAAQRIEADLGAYLGAIEPAHRRMRQP